MGRILFILYTLGLILFNCSCKPVHPFLAYDSKIVLDSIDDTNRIDQFSYLETETIDNEYGSWLEHEGILVSKYFEDKLHKVSSANVDSNYIPYGNLKINGKGQYWYLQEKWNTIAGAKEYPRRFSTTSLFFKNDIDEEEICVINPAEIDSAYNINYYKHSWDNKYIAIGLTKSDQEISTIRVYDPSAKQFLNGEANNSLPNHLGGIEWLPDNSGFLYTYLPDIDPNSDGYFLNSKLKTFKLLEGKITEDDLFSTASEDSALFTEENFPIAYISIENEKYIIGSVASIDRFRNVYITETNSFVNNISAWKPLWKASDMITRHTVTPDYIYYKSAKDNSNFILYRSRIDEFDVNKAEIVFNPGAAVLSDYAITSNGIFIVTTKNGVLSELYKVDSNNNEKIELPMTVADIDLQSLSSTEPDLWLDFRGWTLEETRYYYDSFLNEFREVDLNRNYIRRIENTDVIEIEVVGHDDVNIPVSIIRPKVPSKDLEKNVLLTAYGAFGVSYTPELASEIEKWLSHGGTFVVAHIRGGGEKGDNWHKQGMKETKENSWLDLISVSEYLIRKGYTSDERLCLFGQSAGAVATGMAYVKRPDLYKAAAFNVGLLNPSRNEFGKAGKNSAKEFGSASNDEEFHNLMKMDPYLNINTNVNYPSIYISAGINDSRLSMWHSTKFAAKLKSRKAQKNIVLLDVREEGHGAEVDYESYETRLNKTISFFLRQVGHPDFQFKE